METIKSSQILVRVALICAMATASKPSTRLSASDEPPQKKPDDDEEPIQIKKTWAEVVQDLEELAQKHARP